jgi:hypothetical protein
MPSGSGGIFLCEQVPQNTIQAKKPSYIIVYLTFFKKNWLPMKKQSFFLFLTLIVIIAASCSDGSPEKLAKEACDCMKGAGLKSAGDILSMQDSRETERKVQGRMRDCMQDVGEKIKKEMEDIDDSDDRAQYMKDLLKAALDTDCADFALEAIPYDEMIRSLPGSSKKRRYGGVDVCECVNMDPDDEENKDLVKECEKLAEEYEEDGRMEDLMEEAQNCL